MLQQKDHLPSVVSLKICLFLFLSLCVWQGRAQTANAAVLDVCLSGCNYSSIQDAIDAAAASGDTIEFMVNKQTFNETITINNKSLTFLGQTTTINAQDGGTAVIITGNPTVVMQNMIIQNGNITDGNGGGIRLSGGDLTLSNVTLSSNDVTGNGTSNGLGGCLYIAGSGSQIQLTDVTIQTGTAVSGGAIYNNGTLIADNLTVTDNNAAHGGGIYNNGTATLDASAAQRNIATQSGGAFFNASGDTFTLNNSSLLNNDAADGAGIFNEGSLQLSNTNIGSGHEAKPAGGGLYNNGKSTLTNSTVAQNVADTGAGIFNDGTLMANNSTLSRNTGANGAGLYNANGNATFNNVTIHLTVGTSIFANGGSVAVGNTIISSVSGQAACGGSGTFFSSNGYNLASDQTCTFLTETGDLQGLNPDLNGITSPTEGAAYHSPKITSPVIDAGNPAEPGSGGNACLGSDQRGLARPQSKRCDIGAVEIVVYRVYTPLVIK